jgi:putative hydrolase of the HAD superfamily
MTGDRTSRRWSEGGAMISGPALRWLFLDVGGVLLTNGWDGAARSAAARRFGLDEEEMNERHHLTFDTYELGKLSLDEYLDRTVFHCERPFSREEFKAFMFARSEPYPETIALVREIRSRHRLGVGVVSNEGRELTAYRIRTFHLREFVDFFIASCFVHLRKPDADIFRLALDVAQAEPEQTVYVEDRPMFVEVARSLGMHAIRHRDADSTRRQLEALGLAVDR